MTNQPSLRDRWPTLRAAMFCALLSGAAPVMAHAAGDPEARLRPGAHRGLHRVAAIPRPLTIRRAALRRGRVVVGAAPEPVDRDFVFRDWNDTRLTRWGPFRFGGNVFYGDNRGDPINYGNAGLAQIAGYGPARGGFGGPHFDSVGGFHSGPGPDAQEDEDYASGSISEPDYGGAVPHYPSIRARVATLDRGVVPARGRTAEALRDEDGDRIPLLVRASGPAVRASSTALRRANAVADEDREDADAPGGGPATADEVLPGFDLGGDLF